MEERMQKLKDTIGKFWEKNKDKQILISTVCAIVVLGIVYIASKSVDRTKHVFHDKDAIQIDGGRILGTKDSLYKKREQLLGKMVKNVEKRQERLSQAIWKLEEKVTMLAAQIDAVPTKKDREAVNPQPVPDQEDSEEKTESETTHDGSRKRDDIEQRGPSSVTIGLRTKQHTQDALKRSNRGPSVISFPVKAEGTREDGVVLPSGSFVKAKMMTGVEAPEGKNYPVLLQLDYAFIGPNRSKIDLSGCFGISKAQGDLSTERVQMQVTKLSCVSRKGRMFERKVNGFVADDKDNSFAVIGSVNSKQDRVATTAFLSSIVEGIGKAIQQAQTSHQRNAIGGGETLITGDQAKYIGAGGASSAASMITQWYLKQAQSLLPTINVGSGQDIWIIMQNKVSLPNWYFRKPNSTQHIFSYFTNLVD